jgi:hypothetical protein
VSTGTGASHVGGWLLLVGLLALGLLYTWFSRSGIAMSALRRGTPGLPDGVTVADPDDPDNPEAWVTDADQAAAVVAHDGGVPTKQDVRWGHAVTIGTVVVCAIACVILFPAGGAGPWILSVFVIWAGASAGRALPHHLVHARSVKAKRASGDPGPHQGFFAARRARRQRAKATKPPAGYSPIG